MDLLEGGLWSAHWSHSLFNRSFFFRKASTVSLNSRGLSSVRKCETPVKAPLLVVLAKSPFWTPDYQQHVWNLAPDLEDDSRIRRTASSARA
jgi:hypothetical protein